jgi:hypothetical protein
MQPLNGQQIQDQAKALAMAQVQPDLNNLDAEQRTAQSENAAQQGQIGQYSQWYQQQLNNAFGDTERALNSLMTGQTQADQGAQDAFGAALRTGMGNMDSLQQQLGGSGPGGQEAALLQNAIARRASVEGGTAQQAAAALGGVGERRSLGGLQYADMADTERRRSNAVMQDIAGRRRDVTGRIGNLQAQAQTQLTSDERDFEMAKQKLGEEKASRLFQQWLSQEELGVSKKNQSFQEYLATQELGLKKGDQALNAAQLAEQQKQNAHSRKIDWANVALKRDDMERMMAQIDADAKNAKTKADKDRAQLRGQVIAKGIDWLTTFLAPDPKQEGNPNSRRFPTGAGIPDNPDTTPNEARSGYRRYYVDAYRGLQSQGLSKSDALRVLSKSTYSDWAAQARRELNQMKRRKKGELVVPGSGSPKADAGARQFGNIRIQGA